MKVAKNDYAYYKGKEVFEFMVTMRKRIALSIAQFILSEVEPNSKESTVHMYMRWKEKHNIVLHNPENVRYVLRKFAELGHMNEEERKAFEAVTRHEAEYVRRNL